MLSAWVVPVLVLGATIFDTTLVSISRSRRGLLPFCHTGKDHAAHRLANLGLDSAARCSQCTFLAPFPVRSPCLSAFYRSPVPGVDRIRIVAALSGIAFLERAPYERQTAKPAAAATD